jgi:cyclophilin family peptidyl-prolyl cis-trans isomerase
MEKKDMIIITLVIVAFMVGSLIYLAERNKNSDSKFSQVPLDQAGTSTNNGNNNEQPSPSSAEKQYSEPPTMALQPNTDYKAILKTTKGNITIDLYEDRTPVTVNNFVFLSQDKFYNGTKFHRIISGFMIQGGDPTGTGGGSPGYRFDDEAFEGEYEPGTLAMANAGPNTNGSQFFIMHGNTELPKNYVIFGKVADDASMQVVNLIAQTPVTRSPMGENSQPTENVLINEVEIVTRSKL